MGFTFGTKKSEIKETAGDGVYLRNFRKGDTKVRFLEECNDWHGYFEHYIDGQAVPCMEMDECPSCRSDNDQVSRRSRRYGTFVYLVDQKRVLPFKVGARLSDRLQMRSERNNNTITNRDYIIIRSGIGLDTEYDVDQDERYEVDIAKLWAQRGDKEIEDILAHQFKTVWGDPEQYLSSKPATTPSAAADDDVPDALLSREERLAKAKAALDEFKPKPEENSEVEVSEADLKKMTRKQLDELWEQAKFEGYSEDWSKGDLVEAILERAS
jgi:hypothetical protein